MYRRLTFRICSVLALGLVFASAAHAGLMGWWPFDEGSGVIATDVSGNGHNGTINGNPVWTDGTYGGALKFDGSGDYVMCDLMNIDTAVTGGMTVCGWINRAASGDHKICSNRQAANAAGGGFTCTIYNDRLEMDISSATARTLARDGGGPALPLNTWVFVAWVYDDAGDLFKEYHNDVLVDTDAVTVSVGLSTSMFRIGADSPSPGLYYNGTLDDWRVYDYALSEDELKDAMAGRTPGGELASKPSPADGATEVRREAGLSWTPGEYAVAHDVYFGTVEADVTAANRDNPGDVQVGLDQSDAEYQPPARLELGQTYYWRIDEVNAAPDNTIFKGSTWKFTVEARSYPISNVTATASGSSSSSTGPEKTVDSSGLDADGLLHSDVAGTMWLSNTTTPGTAWIRYAFDSAYKLDKLLVWNSNLSVETFVGFGAKDVTVEYSLDGTTWETLGDFVFTRAPGEVGYAADTTVDMAGVVAQYVKLNIKSNWGGMAQYGLSEVRFFSVPVAAREPVPADGATDIGPEPALAWHAGREAASHMVYLSTDQQAVIDGTAPVATVSQAQYDATADLGTTYYWKVVEVNETQMPVSWDGPVWSFSTAPAIVVDDFETYTDDIDAGETIYQAWADGWQNDTNGSIVGHDIAPFAEQTIVYAGVQSMPLSYDNSSASSSLAERTFDEPQDWTQFGVQSLSLMFFGDPANTGQLYLKINNTKVLYAGPAADLKRTQWQPWQIDLAATGANLKSVTKLTIGIDGAGASGVLYFDNIRLYPKLANLVAPVDPGTTGLQAWYKLDADLKDAIGGNNGTAQGGVKTGADATRGQVLVLDGVDDAVEVPSLGASTTVTIAMWAKITVDPLPIQFASLFHCNGWTAGDLHWRYSYGKVDSGISGVTGDVTGMSVVTMGEWNHVAVTVSETEWALWLNGVKEASRTLTAPVSVNLGDGLIGAWSDGTATSRFFTGSLDDARFYNRALSQEEIAFLAGRTGSFYKPF